MSTFLFSLLGGLFLFVSNPADVDPTGTWKLTMSSPDGQEMAASITFADGSYEADFMMDGTKEVAGSYTIDGDNITLQDDMDASENGCEEAGTYAVTMSGDEMSLSTVSDGCSNRSEVLDGITLTKM